MKRLLTLAVVFLLALSLLTGCGSDDDSAQQNPVVETPSPTPEPTPTPIPTPDVPVTPEAVIPAPQVGEVIENKDVTVQINNEEETISMTPVSGTLSASGGPDFTLYVDQSRYQVNDISGYCYITLRTGMSGDVYAELGFKSGSSSDSLSGSILNEYGMMNNTLDFGEETLGSYTVHHVRGETIQYVFDVYLLDTNGGCMTMVVSTTSETTAHRDRLTGILETLQIS